MTSARREWNPADKNAAPNISHLLKSTPKGWGFLPYRCDSLPINPQNRDTKHILNSHLQVPPLPTGTWGHAQHCLQLFCVCISSCAHGKSIKDTWPQAELLSVWPASYIKLKIIPITHVEIQPLQKNHGTSNWHPPLTTFSFLGISQGVCIVVPPSSWSFYRHWKEMG